jgi:hypothetical protein
MDLLTYTERILHKRFCRICDKNTKGDFRDIKTMEELKVLHQTSYPGWHVSLFMLAHRAGREIAELPG